ncbi:ABC transporter ATP-binding protein [Thalassotalea castellviae]|uniref:ABC transporter ATP-binding protein n=1 Tax=Thalassotalea castellviae TaxID=3075612 RepID=A0ABU3A492_9GAMM|nr:ABC transporter ATP-binding protein [Thalassotalea sp. W431]MDT0604725.1 ABC transporter ATP-binding protein [Thalassotalea sp. W431]
MLNVSNLTRSYGSFVAVDDVSFTIKKGEIIGLLGHNGAGKTTIMKMISGYLEANAGEVSLNGISLKSQTKLLQQQLGYLPENLPVYPEMTVAEYLDYAADLKGMKANVKIAEIKRAIQATDLSAKLLAPIETLSRGYKQRVGVAQAILGRPKLLILDEPTNGLDPEQTQHMRALIKEIAKDATVILSTHIMQEVNALCDRVLILKSGRLVLNEKLAALQHSLHITVKTDYKNKQNLEKISGIKQVKSCGENTLFITISKQEFAQNICSDISKTIIEAGARLFEIYPQKRDLETVFNQINSNEYNQKESDEGVENAA